MLRIELRQMFRPNGLIDDVVVYGTPEDYEQFSERVRAAISSLHAVVLNSDSPICIEISKNNESEKSKRGQLRIVFLEAYFSRLSPTSSKKISEVSPLASPAA